ncbi:MAG: anion permease [Ignavibacteriales bacterium UTCHB3]|nr:MAG: anion permease [Ignavibacteriales bacterium UTCHB3]
MDSGYIALVAVVALSLIFDFINGFHDAANSIATIVSTRVLSPRWAVIWAALFNFAAFFFFGLHVANTIGKGIIEQNSIDMTVIISGLLAAITWNLLTWWFGIPSSSSHTLIGGLVGATLIKGGFSAIIWGPVLTIIAFIFVAPLIGIVTAYGFSLLVMYICRKMAPSKVDHLFRKLQLLSSTAYSIGHGSNDAQKMMGVIYLGMITTGHLSHGAEIPDWVVIACYSAISLGTLSGGWKIVKTMGQKITKLRPFEGFTAETTGALTLFGTAMLGIPVSTTHTITGSIIGSGITKRLSAVKWKVTYELLWAWLLTIPVSAGMAMVIYLIVSRFH